MHALTLVALEYIPNDVLDIMKTMSFGTEYAEIQEVAIPELPGPCERINNTYAKYTKPGRIRKLNDVLRNLNVVDSDAEVDM